MKKGFATSAILYTLLLLFLVLMVGILNNLQNKKTILDALKKDTISALQQDTITDAILDQIALINSKVVEIENKINMTNNKVSEFEEKFNNLQQQIPRIHKIDAARRYELTSGYRYTGTKQTIPANSYFCLSAMESYYYVKPIYITINDNPNKTQNAGNIFAEGGTQHVNATVTYCNYVEQDTIYYIWSNVEVPSEYIGEYNTIILSGFYITME